MSLEKLLKGYSEITMKNLFDYAKKELSQDAYIRWLCENYNCEDSDVCDASLKFLELLGAETIGIKTIETFGQKARIDIFVILTYENGKKVGLFIEDKIGSEEHNQLGNYNKSIERLKKDEKLTDTLRAYYKTSSLDKEEEKRVIRAGWKIIKFEDIVKHWEKYKRSKNIVLYWYSNHIIALAKAMKNKKRIRENNTLAWDSYFKKILVPKYEQKYNCYAKTTRYGYAYFCIFPKGFDKGAPYLEIRSRDCAFDRFKATILIYDLKEEYKSYVDYIKYCIKKSKDSLFIVSNYSKQIASTKKDKKYDSVKNDKDFLKYLDECAKEYCELMQSFKAQTVSEQ